MRRKDALYGGASAKQLLTFSTLYDYKMRKNHFFGNCLKKYRRIDKEGMGCISYINSNFSEQNITERRLIVVQGGAYSRIYAFVYRYAPTIASNSNAGILYLNGIGIAPVIKQANPVSPSISSFLDHSSVVSCNLVKGSSVLFPVQRINV